MQPLGLCKFKFIFHYIWGEINKLIFYKKYIIYKVLRVLIFFLL